MIVVIKTADGDFNVVGTRGDEFVLQGSVNATELAELRKQIDTALEEVPA